VASQFQNRIHYYAAIVSLLLFLSACIFDRRARDEGITAEASAEHYTGSYACKNCHQKKYEDWSGKLMSNFVYYSNDIPESLSINWDKLQTKEEPHLNITDEVLLMVGVKRKLAFVGKDWKVFPYQYNLKNEKRKKRNGWVGQDYRQRCAVCHTVGSDPEAKTFVELNVGCEVCHGPGKAHTENPVGASMKVPGKTDGRDVLFTCRKCHNERGQHARAIEDFSGVFHMN